VDAAFVADKAEVAADAAEFLMASDASAGTKEIASAVLKVAAESPETESAEEPILTLGERRRRVAEVRRALRRVPRNPIAWVELARRYSNLGQLEPAERALRTAVGLAPNNRFVLRAAARFYVHFRDPATARDILRRSQRTPDDPWLLAAEIVASEVAGGTSRWLKRGQRMTESGSFDPLHISELAGAIGTLEHDHGNRRQVRRYFERAMIRPTENTVAQAGWVARHMAGFESPIESTRVRRAFEAEAWARVQEGNFANALDQSRAWLRDEQFSTRPALLGSWIAVTALGNHQAGAQISEDARLANPSDPRILAQLAFCYAALDQLDKAEQYLERLQDAVRTHPALEDRYHWEVYFEADRGLIAFRRGNPQEGEAHYVRAIELAHERGCREEAAIALLYFIGEASQFNPDIIGNLKDVEDVIGTFPASIRPAYEQLLKRIKTKAQKNLARPRLTFKDTR